MRKTRLQLVAGLTRSVLAAVLVVLFCARPAFAWSDPPVAAREELPEAPTPANPHALQITILDGEGALNNIRERTAREPIVQVQDENHKPVAGALILFSAHTGSGGASATFSGAATLSVHTDVAGRATAYGFHPNNKKGSYTIEVTATLGTVTAVTLIHETNGAGPSSDSQQSNDVTPPPPVHHHGVLKWVLIGSGVAVAGVVTGILLTRGTTTHITVGPGGVGTP